MRPADLEAYRQGLHTWIETGSVVALQGSLENLQQTMHKSNALHALIAQTLSHWADHPPPKGDPHWLRWLGRLDRLWASACQQPPAHYALEAQAKHLLVTMKPPA